MDYTKSVMSLLHKLQESGVTITKVHDGEEWVKCEGNSNLAIRKSATETVVSVDTSVVRVDYNNDWANLTIILGNDESEILSDWSCKYDTDLYHIIEEVESEFYNQWEKV